MRTSCPFDMHVFDNYSALYVDRLARFEFMSAAHEVLPMPKLKTWLAAGVLGSAALLLSACGGSEKPEDVAVQFSKYVYEGKSDKMLELIDTGKLSSDEKAVLDGKLKIAMESVKGEVEKNGGCKEVVSTGVTGECKDEGGICTVKLKTTFGNGETEDGEVKIVNVGGKYKVSF